MKTLILASALLAIQVVSHGETALDIARKFDIQKIEAIQAYLDANPEAKDKDQALSILVGANMTSGEFAPVPDLLAQRYELQLKNEQPNLEVIIGEIARPFIEASIVSDQRDKAKAFITRVKADFADSPMGGQVAGILDQFGAELYLPGVGDRMDIAFTDLTGKEIDVSKMGDKVILVDFWATWCGPCIAEMPNVIAAYNKYKDQGFEIIGISLDEDIEAVKGYASQNNMTWPQYADGKGWENELAQRFGIHSIPATFLVGKGGEIVASNLRGPALDEAIEKALAAE